MREKVLNIYITFELNSLVMFKAYIWEEFVDIISFAAKQTKKDYSWEIS